MLNYKNGYRLYKTVTTKRKKLNFQNKGDP